MSSISSNGSGIKKSVSFPENVVSGVFALESEYDVLKEELFYTQQDYRRFRLERRQMKVKIQRMACRSSSRRRGLMHEYEIFMPARDSCLEQRMSRMNLVMEIDNDARMVFQEC